MIKKLLLLVFLIISSGLFSQNTINQWKQHFSFNDIKALKDIGDKIYVATTNAIYIHDISSNTNEVFTTIDGLSGNSISTIFVIEENQLILVGYDNGLLEIIDIASKEVRTLADILIQTDIPSNTFRINNFHRNNDIIYIATNFGIVEYSLTTNTFKETIKFPATISGNFERVNAVSTSNNLVIAALDSDEIKVADINSNLSLNSSWSTLQNQKLTNFINLNDNIYGINENSIYKYNANNTVTPFSNNLTLTNPVINTVTKAGNVTIVTQTDIIRLDENLTKIEEINIPDNLLNQINLSTFNNGQLFVSLVNSGLNRMSNSNFDSLTPVGAMGPTDNNIFRIDAQDDILWAVYGRYTNSFEPPKDEDNNAIYENKGPSFFSNDTWKNFPSEKFGSNTILANITINPNNKDQVFISAYRSIIGLYEFNAGELIAEYTGNNSNLENSINAGVFLTSLTNADYDNNGNLWVYNAETLSPLKQFSTDINNTSEEFYPFSINKEALSLRNSDLVGEELDFDKSGNVFMGLRRNGIIAYEKRTKKNVTYNRSEVANLFGVPVTALKIDLSDDLWLGSSLGLRIIRNPRKLFQGELSDPENIVIEGEDGIAKEFLFGITVTDIEVDANNNKWIGTNGSGVFFVSPDAQETFNIFTLTNSPLPSNTINDIAIDPSNGSVFIATDKGLMEYTSSVIQAPKNFDNFKIFPNPVRPEYGEVNVQIQGITAGAVVKITDIEGNLVYEIENPVINGSGSGAVTWDTRSFSGKKVASGVYLTLITGKDGEQTKIGKLLIIR